MENLAARRLPLALTLKLPGQNEPSPSTTVRVKIYRCERQGLRIFLLDSARTRSKGAVYTYTAREEQEDPARKRGTGHWDAHHLNLILQRGALELAYRFKEKPAIFHCHDGHAAFLPAMMREISPYKVFFKQTRALITIHNAGMGYHQEIHDFKFARQLTGLPEKVLKKGILNQAVDPLLLGGFYAAVNTVSEAYASEINSGRQDDLTGGLGRAYEQAGMKLRGITNGIDPRPFDPRFPADSGLAHAFNPLAGRMEGKSLIRSELLSTLAEVYRADPARQAGADFASKGSKDCIRGLTRFGALTAGLDSPLYTFIGRLTSQKGVNILTRAVSRLFSRSTELQLLILGQGEQGIEEELSSLCKKLKAEGRLAVLIGYNTAIAKMIYAAGDFFLVPSRYEPCGLTVFFAQMMGNLPIVHRVGGLIMVRDGFNGYSYGEHSARALTEAVCRSLDDYRQNPQKLELMRKQAFQEVLSRYTWDRVMRKYLALYQDA